MMNVDHIAQQWFASRDWKPFKFQTDAWKAYLAGKSGLLNAPTGSGKTYALWVPVVMEYMRNAGASYKEPKNNGLQAIWITPIRALTQEIKSSAEQLCHDLEVPWRVGIRTGDTSTAERARQKKHMPELLITTPESLHLLLAQKEHKKVFRQLKAIVVDEWHELLGSKRGVQMELALSRIKPIAKELKIWGISATIGNLEQAAEVLLGNGTHHRNALILKANLKKKLTVTSILPDEIETFPWAGHLGIKLLEKVIPIIKKGKSTLIFTNTRAMAEIWYQRLLDAAPELAGAIAMHHGSISKELRNWVEEALHDEKLKAVVCTSSLDLGVDFRPVETVIQVGSPKGVARFAQRAGRSGHQPGKTSNIYFLPTHALELVEAAALREALKNQEIENRDPYARSFDVLVQYLVTLAVGDGFEEKATYQEVVNTFSYSTITPEEWQWLLHFITTGGQSLHAYDEYKKVVVDEEGLFRVVGRRTAMRHRLSIGTIVSEPMILVKFKRGGRIGVIEEWFISRLHQGDVFWFAGRSLELEQVKDMVAIVKPSNKKTGKVPSYQGGRMPLSSRLSRMLRVKMHETAQGNSNDIELHTIIPLLDVQRERSHIPSENEFLIEQVETKEGYHAFMYPFEGRLVHEAIASLLAYRMSLLHPISFSIAFNDYGFELLSDQEIPIEAALDNDLFTTDHLLEDLQASINAAELARRRFRDIANIAGLVFKGFPGKPKKDKHLQASSSLFFEVFRDHDPDNLLLRQAYNEAFEYQLEETRLREALQRISSQTMVVATPEKPTPFGFPIMVDRFREKVTSEKLADRIKKMQLMVK